MFMKMSINYPIFRPSGRFHRSISYPCTYRPTTIYKSIRYVYGLILSIHFSDLSIRNRKSATKEMSNTAEDAII
jgi:hypothetical protein